MYSRIVSRLLQLAMATLVGLLVCCPLSGFSQDKNKPAEKTFEALKKKLPKIINKTYFQFYQYGSPQVELARQTGPAEAKITIVYWSPTPKKEWGIAFLKLRFYNRVWTATAWQGLPIPGKSAELRFKEMILKTMRTIDKGEE